jgi:uncharacterized membrane protein YraQ (UPF0718 family)
MMALQQWFTLLMSQWLIALPWLLVGVLVANGLFFFVPRNRWESLLPESPWLQLLYGLGLGLVLPVGQCGAFPVTRRLMWQSGSSSLAIAFWLSATSLHPLIIWQIWQAFPENHSVCFFYIGLSGVIVAIVGSIFTWQRQQITHRYQEKEVAQYPAIARPSSYLIDLTPINTTTLPTSKLNILAISQKSGLSIGFFNIVKEFVEWSTWLLFGCLITATLTTFLPSALWTKANFLSIYSTSLTAPLGFFQNTAIATYWLEYGNVGNSINVMLLSAFLTIPGLLLMVNTFRSKALLYLGLLLFLSTLLANLWVNFYVF